VYRWKKIAQSIVDIIMQYFITHNEVSLARLCNFLGLVDLDILRVWGDHDRTTFGD